MLEGGERERGGERELCICKNVEKKSCTKLGQRQTGLVRRPKPECRQAKPSQARQQAGKRRGEKVGWWTDGQVDRWVSGG